MNKLVSVSFTMLLWATIGLGAPKAPKEKTFVGNISDSMCGLKHMMPEGDKDCTLKCVSGGSKFSRSKFS